MIRLDFSKHNHREVEKVDLAKTVFLLGIKSLQKERNRAILTSLDLLKVPEKSYKVKDLVPKTQVRKLFRLIQVI